MGLDRKVTFAAEKSPSWEKIAAVLADYNFPVEMRMIDGQLAFPDETPPEPWQELRLGTPAGMLTLRREPSAVTLVIWGNADPELLRAWNAVTWAVAKATDGRIATEQGAQTAAEFAGSAEMPEGIGGYLQP